MAFTCLSYCLLRFPRIGNGQEIHSGAALGMNEYVKAQEELKVIKRHPLDLINAKRRRSIQIVIAVNILLWLSGSIYLTLMPTQGISLKVERRIVTGSADSIILQDTYGNSMLCSSKAGLLLFDDKGMLKWQLPAPEGLDPVSLQFEDDLHVLTGRYGRALAVTSEGQMLWEFIPRHHEATRKTGNPNGDIAVFYSMAGSIIYGLDASGNQQWAEKIPSSTAINSHRPLMLIEDDASLVTLCNGGIARISPTAQMIQLGTHVPWGNEFYLLPDNMGFLKTGEITTILNQQGTDHSEFWIAMDTVTYQGLFEGRPKWLDQDTGWDSISLLSEDSYREFNMEGILISSHEDNDNVFVSMTQTESGRLFLCKGHSRFTLNSTEFKRKFPSLGSLMEICRISEDNKSSWGNGLIRANFNFAGQRTLEVFKGPCFLKLLMPEAMSQSILAPAWLTERSEIYSLGAKRLLMVNEDGVARVCSITGTVR